jgi:hypothetical protein
MADNYEYDNIMSLAKKAGYKKIMVMRNSWGQGNWAIVNSVTLKPDGKYGFASGHIHYANGNTSNGNIQCAGNYSWRTIKVLEEDMVVTQL